MQETVQSTLTSPILALELVAHILILDKEGLLCESELGVKSVAEQEMLADVQTC